MSDPDDRQPDTESDLSPVERGAWMDIVSACTALGVTERTIQRRVMRGEIQRRTVSGGRAEFWIATPDMSPATSDRPSDAPGGMLALLDRQEALIDHLSDLARQQQAPLLETIREQAEEIGRLKAELTAERERRALTGDTSDTARASWWRRIFGA